MGGIQNPEMSLGIDRVNSSNTKIIITVILHILHRYVKLDNSDKAHWQKQ